MLMFFAAELALVVGKFMPTVRNAVVADPAPARAAGRPEPITTGAGKFRADILSKKVPKRAWQKLSAGAGAK
ncbi:hypothetical protein AB0I02_41630, partial [Streptomyces phaeochromogenes]